MIPGAENPLSRSIIGAALGVHRELGGPGLLESVYEEALQFELQTRGMRVSRQVSVPIFYRGRRLGTSLRVDLLVENRIVVEVKATNSILPVFEAQALTYLRLLDLRLALLLNFGEVLLKDGVRRIVNDLPDD